MMVENRSSSVIELGLASFYRMFTKLKFRVSRVKFMIHKHRVGIAVHSNSKITTIYTLSHKHRLKRQRLNPVRSFQPTSTNFRVIMTRKY